MTRKTMISLDVWNTLFEGAPGYNIRRDQAMAKLSGSAPLECREIYKALKTELDANSEVAPHRAKSHMDCMSELVVRLKGCDHDNYGSFPLAVAFQKAIFCEPPVMDSDAMEAIQEAHAAGVSLAIVSNTNFVSGVWLEHLLAQRLGAQTEFAVQLFSDQFGHHKPSPYIWKALLTRAKLQEGVTAADIVHIGDNPTADGSCAEHGITYRRTNSLFETGELIREITAAHIAGERAYA